MSLKYHPAAAAALAKATADKYFDQPQTTVLPPDQLERQAPTPSTGPLKMSALNRLAEAMNAIPAQVEADAEAALVRLTGAQEKAAQATGKIHNVAGKIEETAQAIEDFANQITNGGPSGPL
jgi:hypothetical protein